MRSVDKELHDNKLKAIAFHASVRLRMKNMGQIKDATTKEVIGIKVRVQVIKNRIGPPLRSVDMEIYFDRGIDNYGSWLKVMKENNLIKVGGSWYSYTDTETGEIHKFQSKEFIQLLKDNPTLEDQMYNHICESTIKKYVSSPDVIDETNIEIDTHGAGMDD
jgi:recombination protein RecA